MLLLVINTWFYVLLLLLQLLPLLLLLLQSRHLVRAGPMVGADCEFHPESNSQQCFFFSCNTWKFNAVKSAHQQRWASTLACRSNDWHRSNIRPWVVKSEMSNFGHRLLQIGRMLDSNLIPDHRSIGVKCRTFLKNQNQRSCLLPRSLHRLNIELFCLRPSIFGGEGDT